MEVPFATPPETPIEPHNGRFSSTVKPIGEYRPDPDGRRAVVILGMPDDTGVTLNKGRPGAKEGPSAIRRVLSRLGVERPATFDWPAVYDAGDVLPAGDDLDETHRRVSEASKALTMSGLLPIGLGGGHDLTFAFVRGVIEGSPDTLKPRTGEYFDPHLDVRERQGSGMPFRRLIEACGVTRLLNTGMDAKANSRDHYEWFLSHGGEIPQVPSEPHTESYFASFDLDALDASHAPGVSAPAPCGEPAFTAPLWISRVVSSRHLRCFDIMELSPPHDEGDRTTRLAAYLFLHAVQHMSLAQP
mgnify:CR=1 FL=1